MVNVFGSGNSGQASNRGNQGLDIKRLRSTPDTIPTLARAAIAPYGNLLSQSLNDRPPQVPGYPQVFGSNVWIRNAPIVSSRRIQAGNGLQYERVQVLSIGRVGGQIGSTGYGEVLDLDTNIYNNLGVSVGTITAWRPGLISQAPLPQQGIWCPQEDGCCVCDPSTGVSNIAIDGGGSGVLLILTLLADNQPHAWQVQSNGVNIGTIWQAARASAVDVTIDITTTLPANITLTPITIGGSAPVVRVDPSLGQANIAPFTGTIALQALPAGLVASPAVLGGVFSGGLASNYPGLCVVQTLSKCEHPPVFKILKGKSCRNIVAAGTQLGSVDPVLPVGAAIGDTFRNHSTGAEGVITQTSPLQVSPNVVLGWGDAWQVYRVGQAEYLPDITIALTEQMLHPPEIDYAAMAIAREYCAAGNGNGPYKWRGLVEDYGLQKFMILNAPQCSLIPSTDRGAIGFIAEKFETPVALFTVGNSSMFELIFHPYSEHRLNRLILWDDLAGVRPSGIVVEADNLSGGSGLLEEALTWEHCHGDTSMDPTYDPGGDIHRQDLGRLYYRSIVYQDRSIRFRTSWEAYQIQKGQIIEAICPDLETGPNFSGHSQGLDAGGNLITSWQPTIASGITGAGSGGGVVIDPDADFTQLVSVGDAINIEGSVFAIVTVSPTQLGVDPAPIAGNTDPVTVGGRYAVLDLTLDPDVFLVSWDPETGGYGATSPNPVLITDPVKGATVRYQVPVPVAPLGVGLPIAIRKGTPNLFRVASVTPVTGLGGAGNAGGFEVVATRWSDRLYDYAGLRLIA